MRYVGVLLALLAAGCATATPPPQTATTQPAAPEPAPSPPLAAEPADTPVASKPADAPVAAATPKPAAAQPVASEPATKTVVPPTAPQAARRTATPVAAAPKPAAAPATAARSTTAASTSTAVAAAPLDLDALKARLKDTKAIGVFTKLSLKNKVDDLMKQFADHYQGKKPTIAELRLSYDLLMMKVLTLLQDADKPLASAVFSSREAIWALLADEKTFAALDI